jgi:DNA-binding beta-propeller fold protein YncE
VFDRADNFYINGGTGNNRIQKVDAATGLITTVTGHLNGEACAAPAPCGDGGMATDAWVTGALPGSTFDAAGNFYFSGSNRVRKITARVIGGVAQPLDGTETVTAFAGTGDKDPFVDNIDATLATLNSPRGLAIDPSGENLYIADLFNNRVRKVNLTTGIITTAVGMTGVECFPNTDPCGDEHPVERAKITSPTSVSFDSHGNLYVNSQTRIRKVDTSGIITTVAGTGVQGFSGDGGPALAATLSALRGGGFDAADNYYLAEAGTATRPVPTEYDGSTWRLRSNSSPIRPAGSRYRSSFPPVGTHLSSTRIR